MYGCELQRWDRGNMGFRLVFYEQGKVHGKPFPLIILDEHYDSDKEVEARAAYNILGLLVERLNKL